MLRILFPIYSKKQWICLELVFLCLWWQVYPYLCLIQYVILVSIVVLILTYLLSDRMRVTNGPAIDSFEWEKKQKKWQGGVSKGPWNERSLYVCVLCGEGGLRLVVRGPPWASLKKLRNLKREHGDDSSGEALKDCSFFFSQSTVIVLEPQFPATGQVSVIL